MTDDEWGLIDYYGKHRLEDLSVVQETVDGHRILRFCGISDKQAATELCAYFGLRVMG